MLFVGCRYVFCCLSVVVVCRLCVNCVWLLHDECVICWLMFGVLVFEV